ncbi:MAG: hypothetical protein JST86_15460 [Bacteroidetes bacterium]|nr:hypothetical protein [Bacteroidota bacterium]
MKIEQLLVQHFYLAKKVGLEGIGSFSLSPDVILPGENDKDVSIPENAISFEYNPKTPLDEPLVDYIVKQTRKIRPLAVSDLESYFMLASQFVNIGKPFKIEGIGVLEKSQSGEFRFYQGDYVNTKIEDPEAVVKDKIDTGASYAADAPSSGSNNTIRSAAIGVLILAALGLGAWYFLMHKKEPVTTAQNTTETPTATPETKDTTHIDTTSMSHKPDSVQAMAPAPVAGEYTFRVVIKNYPSYNPAKQAYDRLTSYGHKLLLYTNDSVTYKVALPIKLPLRDSTYVLDSVRTVLFGGHPYIELK